MSDDLLTKDKLKHIIADLEAEDELYEKQRATEEGEPIKGRKVEGAEMALSLSAGGTLSHALVSESPDLRWAKEDNIERDGCQFIDAIYLFLDELGCPPDARDFVLAVAGISRGNYSDFMPITDDQICRRMGLGRETVRKKRKSLIGWEQANDWSVLEIHEKEFNREKMKYKPTEYRVTVTPFAARFIREYRKRTSFKQGYKALENNIVENTKEIASQIAEGLPNAPIVRRQQKRVETSLGKKPQSQFDKHHSSFAIDRELNAVFKRWCAEQVKSGRILRDRLEQKQWELQEVAMPFLNAQEKEEAA